MMGESAKFYSAHREQLARQLVELARELENESPSHCRIEQLTELHRLASNPALNTGAYTGQARACIEVVANGAAFYQAFDEVKHFCVRVAHNPPFCKAA